MSLQRSVLWHWTTSTPTCEVVLRVLRLWARRRSATVLAYLRLSLRSTALHALGLWTVRVVSLKHSVRKGCVRLRPRLLYTSLIILLRVIVFASGRRLGVSVPVSAGRRRWRRWTVRATSPLPSLKRHSSACGEIFNLVVSGCRAILVTLCLRSIRVVVLSRLSACRGPPGWVIFHLHYSCPSNTAVRRLLSSFCRLVDVMRLPLPGTVLRLGRLLLGRPLW